MNHCMKVINVVLVIMMVALVAMPVQAQAPAPIRMEINGTTGVTTFSLPPKANLPQVMTLIRGEIPQNIQLSWEKVGSRQIVRFLIPGDTTVVYFDSLAYRIIPQGIARRIWQEAQNHDAICLKRRDRQPCQ